jgi:hypothetical protein
MWLHAPGSAAAPCACSHRHKGTGDRGHKQIKNPLSMSHPVRPPMLLLFPVLRFAASPLASASLRSLICIPCAPCALCTGTWLHVYLESGPRISHLTATSHVGHVNAFLCGCCAYGGLGTECICSLCLCLSFSVTLCHTLSPLSPVSLSLCVWPHAYDHMGEIPKKAY